MARLDADVESLLPAVRLREEHRAQIERALDHLACERSRERESGEKGLRQQYEALRAKRLRLVDLYAAQEVSQEDYDDMRSGYDREMQSLAGRLAALSQDLSGPIARVKEILAQASAINTFYARCGSMEERKRLLSRVFRRIYVSGRTIQRIEYQPPFHLLAAGEHAKGSGIQVATELLDGVINRDIAP